jgi:hypothetical protein
MTAKFTKGSWQYDSSSGLVLDEHGDIVCDVMPDGREECEHNGHVLAQAGAMYEMLDEISDGLFEAGGFGNCALAKRIEAILAKARGES